MSINLPAATNAKAILAAALVLPALLGGCSSRDEQMAEKIAAANAAAARAEQAADRAEHAAANAQRAMPRPAETTEPDPSDGSSPDAQPKSADAQADTNGQVSTVEG